MNRMSASQKIIIGITTILLLGCAVFFFKRDFLKQKLFAPTVSKVEQGVTGQNKVVTLAKELTVPWDVTFLPNNDMLVTERPGTLLRISNTSEKFVIHGVKQTSEGGLLGLAAHPNYADNHWLYLYYTTQTADSLTNIVERYELRDDKLVDQKVIIKDIPASNNHDGGGLAFGPDKKLYVTTGDAGQEELAQNKASLAGKILRVNDDGTIPGDNPFNSAVYSYGHRNAQGLAWDDNGQLWSTEHGRSGVRSGYDEVNLIVKGGNYGWPIIEGDETKAGMTAPVAHSGPDDTWAPAGLAYSEGYLFFTGLRGQALYGAKISKKNTLTLKAHFKEEYGRLRAVASHNGAIYFSTSNTDGRGVPKPADDRILRINRDALSP